MPPPPQISQWIRNAYPKPRVDDDWLDACCTWIADELHLDPATQTQEFISNVETQLLESNLCDSMVEGTGLPMNALTMNNERIHGPPVLVEVTAITEIGHSAFNLQNVRQTRIERADLVGLALEEGGENDEGPIPNYPRTMLRLEVCDGSVTIPAIEYREIPDLKLGESPLGFKILLKDVLVRRGILFLEPGGIELKGHRTEDRDEFQDRDFVRGLCRRLGKPPPLDEEQVDGEEDSHAPSATLVPPANRHVPAARPEQMQIRSPLREISEPPELRPDDMDLDDEADLPRRRRIPNPNRNLPTASASSTKTSRLVTSHFFAGGEGPSTVSAASSATEVLARALSPVRGARIDVDIDIDAGVDDFEGASRSRRSATAAGKQRQVTSAQRNSNTISNTNTGDGSGSVARNNSEEFDFGSDADIDAAFLDEVEKVEKAALENSQMQSKAVSQIHAQVQLDRPAGGRMRTPVPASATRRSQSQLPAQAVSYAQPPVPSQPRAHSQRPQTQTQLRTRPVPQDVITIEDDEEDDKENVPVPRRRVRRRISTTPDDVVIDLSD